MNGKYQVEWIPKSDALSQASTKQSSDYHETKVKDHANSSSKNIKVSNSQKPDRKQNEQKMYVPKVETSKQMSPSYKLSTKPAKQNGYNKNENNTYANAEPNHQKSRKIHEPKTLASDGTNEKKLVTLDEVTKLMPKRFIFPMTELYTKLKVRSNDDEKILLMLLKELFKVYSGIYNLECMMAVYSCMVKDSRMDIAHNYLSYFKQDLVKNQRKIEYAPTFLNFAALQPQSSEKFLSPDDSFIPEAKYLSIIDLGYKESQVHWVDFKKASHVFEVVRKLRNEAFALDAEWRPIGVPKIALLQIATTTEVFLFDTLSMVEAEAITIEEFASLFRDEKAIKIFFGVREDVAQLITLFGNLAKAGIIKENLSPKDIRGIVDLEAILPTIIQLPKKALKNYAEEIFKKELSKMNQCSNWNNRPLRSSQKHYAALDAIIPIKIYEKLKKENHEMRIYTSFEDYELERLEKKEVKDEKRRLIWAEKKEKYKNEKKDEYAYQVKDINLDKILAHQDISDDTQSIDLRNL